MENEFAGRYISIKVRDINVQMQGARLIWSWVILEYWLIPEIAGTPASSSR
jgi:hypothetical protein